MIFVCFGDCGKDCVHEVWCGWRGVMVYMSGSVFVGSNEDDYVTCRTAVSISPRPLARATLIANCT